MWHTIVQWFVKITGFLPWYLLSRPKIYYEDKTTQSRRIKGSAILAPNHKSVWDVAAMLFVFPFRTARCLIAEIMFQKNPFFSFFLKAFGGIKIDRDAYDFTFVEKSCDILEKGGVVEIYPEARLPLEGEATPLPFKPSVIYMALQTGAPIIPIYTNGEYFSKQRANIIIGKPFDARAYYDEERSEKDNVSFITEKLRERIIELQHELQRQTNQN